MADEGYNPSAPNDPQYNAPQPDPSLGGAVPPGYEQASAPAYNADALPGTGMNLVQPTQPGVSGVPPTALYGGSMLGAPPQQNRMSDSIAIGEMGNASAPLAYGIPGSGAGANQQPVGYGVPEGGAQPAGVYGQAAGMNLVQPSQPNPNQPMQMAQPTQPVQIVNTPSNIIQSGKVDPNIGSIIIDIKDLKIILQNNIYVNIRTKNARGQIITPKQRTDVITISGPSPFGKKFLMNFKSPDDKLVLHIWKKNAFANSNCGELECRIHDLLDPNQCDRELFRTFPLKKREGSTVTLGSAFQFNIAEANAMANIPAENTTNKVSCAVIMTARMSLYSLQSWLSGLSIPQMIGEVVNSVFAKPGLIHDVQKLGAMKGSTFKFAEEIAKVGRERYGVNAETYTITEVIINIPPMNVINQLQEYTVYRVYTAQAGGISKLVRANEVFQDSIKSPNKYFVESTAGRIMSTRELLQGNHKMFIKEKQYPDIRHYSFSDLLKCPPPQFL